MTGVESGRRARISKRVVTKLSGDGVRDGDEGVGGSVGGSADVGGLLLETRGEIDRRTNGSGGFDISGTSGSYRV